MDARVVMVLLCTCLALPASCYDTRDAILPIDPAELDRLLQAPRPSELGRILDNIGAVYTHWGRNTCSQDSTLVYEGFVGGTWYKAKGGAAQYLCLPLVPEYSQFIRKRQGNSNIQTAELETKSKQIPAFERQNQHTPVCAVCQAFRRPAYFMFPARVTCPTGWTKEYDGYLMSAAERQERTEFICVDSEPEVLEGTSKNDNGALLYFIETNTRTSMPDTYMGEKELTCSVCTK
ncbi:short-chain collagen C4-like [Sycon ciliatum]|uniref:short-chain collagen C4-like n=1 Tax=Sycon ciliatum TaxID=27933 RepID=UPI0031F6AEBD